MIPCMQSAHLYDELDELDDLLSQYANAAMLNEEGRKNLLSNDIRNMSEKLNLFSPSGNSNATLLTDGELIEKSMKTVLLRDSNINDGLHILSETGHVEKMTRMILSILKYDGSVPSIRRCILEAMGQDYDEIVTQSKNTSILDQCESKAFAMVSDLLMSNHIHKKMVSAQFNGLDWQHPKMIKLRTLLTWIKDKTVSGSVKDVPGNSPNRQSHG